MEVKESVEQVFEQLGSVEAYLNWAATNPDAFYNNHWIKLLPKNLTVDAQVRVEHLFNPDQLRRMADLQEED